MQATTNSLSPSPLVPLAYVGTPDLQSDIKRTGERDVRRFAAWFILMEIGFVLRPPTWELSPDW